MGLALAQREENSYDSWKDSTEGYPADKLSVTPKSAHPVNESATQEEVNKTRFALIDSRPLTRVSIANLLTTISDEFVILPYSDIDEFVTKYLERPCKVEMVVFNLGSARISENHISKGILRLKLELPDLPLVFLSDHDEIGDIVDAIQIGARGYISSVFNPSTVIQSLRLVMEGGAFIPHNVLLEITGKTSKLQRGEERPERSPRSTHLACRPLHRENWRCSSLCGGVNQIKSLLMSLECRRAP